MATEKAVTPEVSLVEAVVEGVNPYEFKNTQMLTLPLKTLLLK